MSASKSGISVREFARRDGCDEKLVRRKVKSGHLAAFQDGTIDAALIGTAWRKSAASMLGLSAALEAPANTGATASAPAATSSQPALLDTLKTLLESGAIPTKADAERVKETYLALLRRQEYEVAKDKLVEIEAVARVVEREYAVVRERLLSIPGKMAAKLVGRDRSEIELALQGEINEALNELHDPDLDGGSESGGPSSLRSPRPPSSASPQPGGVG